MAEVWVQIRVKRGTRDRLAELQKALTEQLENNPEAAELGRWDTVTVDQAIQVLLNRRDKHKGRSKKASKSRPKEKFQPILNRVIVSE